MYFLIRQSFDESGIFRKTAKLKFSHNTRFEDILLTCGNSPKVQDIRYSSWYAHYLAH